MSIVLREVDLRGCYRRLGETLKVMNVNSNLAGYNTTEDFVNELSKHIKITKTCFSDKLTDCFAETITTDGDPIDTTKLKQAKNLNSTTDYRTNKDIRGINVAIKTGADVLVIGQIPTPVDCSTDSAEDTLCGIYNNRDKYGITSGWFYSTSEVDETFVWSVYFKNGSVGNVVYGKASRNNVVCVGN